MIKAAATVGAAAILAGLVSIVAPPVEAGTPTAAVAGASQADESRSAGCTQRAWPYSQHGCLTAFDARWHGEPRKVRLVTADRLN